MKKDMQAVRAAMNYTDKVPELDSLSDFEESHKVSGFYVTAAA